MNEPELEAAVRRETAAYVRLAVVSTAESEIRDLYARQLDLLDNVAWQRLEAAEIRLCAAEATGNETKIAAALDRVRHYKRAAMRVSAEAVMEHGTLRRAQLRCDEELRAQHRRMTDAVYAAAAIPVRTSEPMRRDPPT